MQKYKRLYARCFSVYTGKNASFTSNLAFECYSVEKCSKLKSNIIISKKRLRKNKFEKL